MSGFDGILHSHLVSISSIITIVVIIMTFISECLDSLIHAIQIISQSVAFLLGIHLVVILHFIQFLTTDPIGALRKHTSRRNAATLTTTTTTARRPRVYSNHENFRSNRRAPHPRLLRLPSLEPRPHEDPAEEVASNVVDYLTSTIGTVGHKMREEIVDLADQIESRGGKTG